MSQFETISQSIYEWVSNILFGEVTANEWYTAHLDVIRGVMTVVMCGVVVLFALALVVAVMRFLGGIFRGK